MYRDKWLQYKDDWYFFGDYGEMYYGDTFEIDGKNYTFDSDGKWLE
ncbi:hypothetical protein [Clostridium saccharobutylicum]|nr:hypothetical protein [Clostridium saccharobutylicum]NSB89266.1 glucan-binding YG repeat protein [Clostridium saccharobutylicum]NYC27920.1 glucan-binding YG repeat protein [Clostridium saccharobutylicum]